jgi:hypothetical protein
LQKDIDFLRRTFYNLDIDDQIGRGASRRQASGKAAGAR